MQRLGLWLVVLALAAVFAEPARPDPLDTGSGAQRSFLWHAGDGSVKRLPPEAHHWVWRELPITVPCERQMPGEDYDPWLDNADAPPCYAYSYCPTNGLLGTAEEPIDCYTNRPRVFEIENREEFPGLDTIFEVGGADGELGPNPDYFLADPEGSVNDLLGLPDPTTQDYERILRGLALERDDPAYYTLGVKVDTEIIGGVDVSAIQIEGRSQAEIQQEAAEIVYGGDGDPSNLDAVGGFAEKIRDAGRLARRGCSAALARVPNPFRGRETPTRIVRPDAYQGDPERLVDPRAVGERYQILDVASGVFDPTADCDTGLCRYGPDPIDPRLLKYEQLLILADRFHQEVCIGGHCPGAAQQPNWFGPYPNLYLSEKFPGAQGQWNPILGGDFSGIAARYRPYTTRAVPGAPLQGTPFIEQVAFSETPGYWSVASQQTIAYTNLRVKGGFGELPMRVAPDRSNLAQPLPLVAQGLDYPFPEGAEAYERNVDPNTGRPRKAGATGRCENAAGFQIQNWVGGRTPILHAGNPRLEFIEGDASAAMTGEATPNNTGDDYRRRGEPYTILGVGIDEACLKPGGAPLGPNENRFNPDLAPDPADFPCYSSRTVDPPDPSCYIYQTLGQWRLEGSSVDYALAHQPANQSLFAWICSASEGYFASLAPGACLLDLFDSPTPLARITGVSTVPFSEFFAVLTAGEIDADVQNYSGWRLLQQILKSGRAIGWIPSAPLNRDVRDGLVTATTPWIVQGGDPWSYENFLSLDSTLTSAQSVLLGCGPYSGTRCDSGAIGRPYRSPGAGGPLVGWEFGEGGGIDLLNAEASAVAEALAGSHGTGDVGERVVAGLGRFVGSADTDDFPLDSPATWSDDAQPGTIDFVGSPVCTRYAPESPYADDAGIVRLPGCRGARRVTVNHEISQIDKGAEGIKEYPTIDVVFDLSYSTRWDGCLFSEYMRARDEDGTPNGQWYAVRAVNEDGSTDGEAARIQAELNETCFNAIHPERHPEGLMRVGNASLRSTWRFQRWWKRDTDPPDWRSWGYEGPSEWWYGTRTLFHPLAGCESAGPDYNGEDPWLGPDDELLCDFRNRNLEADFIEGHAQVFRSEISAWSWNFLMFLAVTSCDSSSGGDDLADPDCFDPELAWDVTRCSLSAPQLCRNAQILLELASGDLGAVEIDIRPGVEPNFIQPSSRRLIQVALLGSESFDVADVNVSSLAFGPAGASPVFDLANRWVYFLSHRDVNGDHKEDLLSSYRAAETGIVLGDSEACLGGEMRDGTPFQGCDAILTVPGCGIGCELAFLLPLLLWLRGRRSRA